MERALMKDLRRWQASPRRKPLVLKGARQVGKTWLMKEFGRQCYAKTAYVNFDKNPRMKQVFDQDFDIERILIYLLGFSPTTFVHSRQATYDISTMLSTGIIHEDVLCTNL